MKIQHHFSAGTYIKETTFDAGEWGVKHAHSYDHASVLSLGTVRLEIDGVEETISAPKVLTVAAGKSHKVTAITPAVWLCIHATSCTDAERIDQELTEA